LPFDVLGFYHFSPEVWYDKEDSSTYVICENIEDPNCSLQVKPSQWKGTDHNYYIGIHIAC